MQIFTSLEVCGGMARKHTGKQVEKRSGENRTRVRFDNICGNLVKQVFQWGYRCPLSVILYAELFSALFEYSTPGIDRFYSFQDCKWENMEKPDYLGWFYCYCLVYNLLLHLWHHKPLNLSQIVFNKPFYHLEAINQPLSASKYYLEATRSINIVAPGV